MRYNHNNPAIAVCSSFSSGNRMNRYTSVANLPRLLGASVITAVAFAACSSGEKSASVDSAATSTATVQACAGDNAGLTLAPGFCAVAFADTLRGIRHLAIAGNGDVYAALEGTNANPNAKKPGAAFIAMRDTNGDGVGDVIKRIASMGNTGIALFNGFLYVDEGEQIVRYARSDTSLAPEGKREVVVSGIPLSPGHRARNFAIASDGALFLNVGSATNSCQKKDRGLESPGIDPCTELETRAGIWKFDANKTGQRFSAAARYASGLRNGMGLAFSADSQLYATQHGRDGLHDSWPNVFTSTQYQAQNPAEELMVVAENDDFGWPYCYYSADEKKLVDAPEYGGDGKKADRCSSKKGPVAALPGHWAPMSLLFHSGTGNFPARYKDGVFIAFHGSWNRAPEPQGGYNVVFQPMSGGSATGDYEVFADGFAGLPATEVQPGAAKHRPVGLATGPDGALYVSDDAGGRLYKITYEAGK